MWNSFESFGVEPDAARRLAKGAICHVLGRCDQREFRLGPVVPDQRSQHDRRAPEVFSSSSCDQQEELLQHPHAGIEIVAAKNGLDDREDPSPQMSPTIGVPVTSGTRSRLKTRTARRPRRGTRQIRHQRPARRGCAPRQSGQAVDQGFIASVSFSACTSRSLPQSGSVPATTPSASNCCLLLLAELGRPGDLLGPRPRPDCGHVGLPGDPLERLHGRHIAASGCLEQHVDDLAPPLGQAICEGRPEVGSGRSFGYAEDDCHLKLAHPPGYQFLRPPRLGQGRPEGLAPWLGLFPETRQLYRFLGRRIVSWVGVHFLSTFTSGIRFNLWEIRSRISSPARKKSLNDGARVAARDPFRTETPTPW